MALPRDAEADGSAVVERWAAAEPLGGALRGGATQRVPWLQPAVSAKAGKDLAFIDPVSVGLNGSVLERSFAALRMT